MLRILSVLLMALPLVALALGYSARTSGPDAANAHLSGVDRLIADVELMLDDPALQPAVGLYDMLFSLFGEGAAPTSMQTMDIAAPAAAAPAGVSGDRSAGGAKFVTVGQ